MFALLMLFLCVILHTTWSGKSLQLLCILPFGIVCLSAVMMMVGVCGSLQTYNNNVCLKSNIQKLQWTMKYYTCNSGNLIQIDFI